MEKGKWMPLVVSGVLIGTLLFASAAVLADDAAGTGKRLGGDRAGHSQRGGQNQGDQTGLGGEAKQFRGSGFPGLAQLVSKGVLTQEQADQIKNYCQNQAEQRKAEMEADREKVQAMTEAERQAYFEQKRGQRPDLLAELVTAGIISQEQADQLKAAMPQPGEGFGKGRGHKGGFPGLAQLVSKGVLTQEQADQIKNYCQNQAEQRKAEMEADREKVQAMTETERQAYFEQKRGQRSDLLAELVTAGIISQEQADQLKAEMPLPPQGPPVRPDKNNS